MTPETLENNKKIARQMFEALDKNELDSMDKVANPEKFKLHFPGKSGTLNFNDAKKLNTDYIKSFPGTKTTIDMQIAEGDYVCTHVTYEGTHKGELEGIPASNKKIKVTGIVIHRFENDKIVEEWDEFDQLGMMQQIGAIPELATSQR